LFISGLIIEIEEIRNKERLKGILNSKFESMEKLVRSALEKIESDSRIKERISKGKREIIEWLSRF
jgi:hypothetical protein